ncbi:MAG: hypothetical protein K2Y37_05860 [Pirellulales bacterium]|nr:hypothetical protein [Pirellulales bacterium]
MSSLPEKLETPGAVAGQSRPLQFSLRTLLVVISLASALFAVLSVVPPVWSFMALWVALLVIAHVAANAWGKRTFEPGAVRPDDSLPRHAPPRHATWPTHPASLAATSEGSRLRRHATLERSRYVATFVTAGIGGLIGCVVLALIHLHQASFAACAVWTGASAVISGIAGFVGSGFWQVVRRSTDELAPLP